MKSFAILILLFLMTSCLEGCMHTYIGGPSVESPDNNYYIYLKAHGKSAHAYTEYTVKKVSISIVDTTRSDSPAVFFSWVILKASDLSWRCTWLDAASVKIDFFERKKPSEINVNYGSLILKKKAASEHFEIIEQSKNLEIKAHNYFF